MATTATPLQFTETEIRSYLPTGWGIVRGASGRWDAADRSWSIEIYDGADNAWKVRVDADSAARSGRLEALRAGIDRLERKALGRKSVISG